MMKERWKHGKDTSDDGNKMTWVGERDVDLCVVLFGERERERKVTDD